MRSSLFTRPTFKFLVLSTFLLGVSAWTAAQNNAKDYVLLTGPNSPGTIQLGSSVKINGGSVGASKLIQANSGVNINANFYSGDKISLGSGVILKGNLSAAANYPNSPISTGNILSAGSSASITGKADVFGNVLFGSGVTFSGTLTIPASASYSGSSLGNKLVKGTPTLQSLPSLPQAYVINPATYPVISTTITGDYKVGPGNYGNINFGSSKKLTLLKPGIYVFNSVKMGSGCKLIFDFSSTAGNYQVYIRGNAEFGSQFDGSIAGGGDASRIYVEVQGTGISGSGNSVLMGSGSTGNVGTWYATNGSIDIGSGSGNCNIGGALWSKKSITLGSSVTINYAPFNPCTGPGVTAGIGTNPFTPVDTIPLDFTGHLTLSATSNTPGTNFVWQATKGGKITSSNTNTATIEVEAIGNYIVSAYTDDANCVSKDTVVIPANLDMVIGPELLSIYRNYDPNNPDLDSFFVTENGYVTIDIICKVDTTEVINLLSQLGYPLINRIPNGKSIHTITGDFKVADLLKLNDLRDKLSYCKAYFLPSLNGVLRGLVISQGDTTMKAFLVRKGLSRENDPDSLDGRGIKIGVISDSYKTVTDPSTTLNDACANINQTLIVNKESVDVSNGELGNVTLVEDFPVKRTDEGRAMIQIIHDLAPGAQKFFSTGVYTKGYLASTIENLAALGCDIIVDDVSYTDDQMLKDGIVAKSIKKVRDDGVFYVTSAGNFGRQSYEKDFNGVDATSIGFPGKKAHNFGSNNASPDFFQKIMLKPGTCFIAFQWLDDNFSLDEGQGTKYDLDIFLAPGDKTDGTSLISFSKNNKDGDAAEFIPITIPGNGPCDTEEKPYNILIVNNTTTGNPGRIKYVVFKGGYRALEYNEGNSTIVGHANSDFAFTVGAVRSNHVPGHPLLPASLAGITKPQIESFSSYGGTMNKEKPNGAGADGVDVTVLMGQDYPAAALNGFSNFFGTSAAGPHIAASAALVIQARTKFLNQSTTPDQLKTLLQSTATDMRPAGLVGYDFSAGAGLINVDAAIRTFATPKPFEIKLLKPTNIIPCDEPFELIIVGENFSNNTKVYLVEAPGDSTILTPSYISPTRDTIKVNVSSCEGNPEVVTFTASTVRNPPVAGGAPDGGFSNSIKLFSKEIVIQTQNVSKKYGQANPTPATTIAVDGNTLAQAGLTLADIGLDASKLNLIETNATTYSDVGTYSIKVYRTFDKNNATDLALINQYRYTFRNGLITINKMPLKVTPNDITAAYGNQIGEVSFKYEFVQDQPANAAALKDTAKKYHEAFLPKNALAVIKDFKKQQRNGSILSDADLAGISTLVSSNALGHSRKFKIVNNKLVSETDPNSINSQYIVDVASESFYEFKQDPTLAKFYTPYPGVNKKAVLGEAPLDNYEAEVQVTNGGISSLKTLINGYPGPVLNGTGISRLAPMINGELITMLNGQLATLNTTTGQLTPTPGSPSIQFLNGSGRLMYLVNGAVTFVPDNSYVVIPNLAAGLHVINGNRLNYLINGVEDQVITSEEVLPGPNGTLLNGRTLQTLINGSVLTLGSRLGLATLINGTGISRLSPLINGTGISRLSPLINDVGLTITNGGISRLMPIINTEPEPGGGTSTNKTAVIFDETDINESLNNYLGALFGINTLTGLEVGVQKLIPGKLVNTNFDITYVTGKVTIQSEACLLTHSTFSTFNSTPTPAAATSLWLTVTTKVDDDQFYKKGDYLLFKGGSVTFNSVNSAPTITDLDIPDGKIIADDVSSPVTSFDSVNNIWITKVPVNCSKESEIFITGVRINSSTGFTKGTSPNSVVKGRFYSNKICSAKWGYAIAAYRPQFWYAAVDDPGAVVPISGTYKAGTPLPIKSSVVSGGSGTGGTNYIGNKSAYDYFSPCKETTSPPAVAGRSPIVSAVSETTSEKLAGIVSIYPNPATNQVIVSFVPEQSGNSKIMLYTIDGRKVLEVNNGMTDSGKLYLRSMDVSKLTKGIYMIQLWSGNKVTIKKLIID